MNIYNAIMNAADFIQRNPGEFNYFATRIPNAPSCGTPGCALGWIGAMAGLTDDGFGIARVAGHEGSEETPPASTYLGIDQSDFYIRMDEVFGRDDWRYSAERCACAMRLYAEEYHGHEKPQPMKTQLPDWQTIAASPLIPEHVKSEELVS